MKARSLAPVPGHRHQNLRAWIEICPHAWQPLSWVLMRPLSCFLGPWVQAMKIQI